MNFKGTVHKIKNTSFLPVVLFITLDSFGVSCRVLEISAVEISAFSNIIGVNGALNLVLTTQINTFKKLISNISF